MDAPVVDPSSGIPPYRQLAAILRQQIETGELAGRLPGEKAIAQQYEVALGTCRKALDLLRSEGFIETSPGWGSRILEPGERPGGGEP